MKWLYQAIVDLNWHPFLRVNTNGLFRPQGYYHLYPFSYWVQTKGRHWQGKGTAFSGKKISWIARYWFIGTKRIRTLGWY